MKRPYLISVDLNTYLDPEDTERAGYQRFLEENRAVQLSSNLVIVGYEGSATELFHEIAPYFDRVDRYFVFSITEDWDGWGDVDLCAEATGLIDNLLEKTGKS
jgi:hypothetical protein